MVAALARYAIPIGPKIEPEMTATIAFAGRVDMHAFWLSALLLCWARERMS